MNFLIIVFSLSLIKPISIRMSDVLCHVSSLQEHPASEEDDPGQGDLRPRLPVLHAHLGPEEGPALPPHLQHRGHQHQQRLQPAHAELQVFLIVYILRNRQQICIVDVRWVLFSTCTLLLVTWLPWLTCSLLTDSQFLHGELQIWSDSSASVKNIIGSVNADLVSHCQNAVWCS